MRRRDRPAGPAVANVTCPIDLAVATFYFFDVNNTSTLADPQGERRDAVSFAGIRFP